MAIRFELKRDPLAGLVPAGIHRFVVETVEERTGDKGPYLNLRLAVYVKGVKWGSRVYDILSTSTESKFKVDQFFDAVGANEEGSAGAAWFVNKGGWARFTHGLDTKKVMRANVKTYLTQEQAEDALSKQANDEDPEPFSVSAPAASPSGVSRKAGTGRKAAVAEMEDDGDEAPF